MPFDALYGSGAEAEWLGLFERAAEDVGLQTTVQFVDIPGGVRVYAKFTNDGEPAGQLKADHYRDRVEWMAHHILIPRLNHHAALVARVGPWYVEKGAARQVIPAVAGEDVPVPFLKTGFQRQQDGQVTLDLKSRRAKQWLAWKSRKAAQPKWREKL